MKAKSRKIWSIPIALVMVLALAAMVGLYGIVQAQSAPGVPSTLRVVAPTDAAPVVRFKVSNVPAVDATVGAGAIDTDEIDVVVERETDAAGTAVTPTTSPSLNVSRFIAAFQRAAVAEQGVTLTGATRFNHIAVTQSDPLTAGHTYTVKITSRYDTDVTVAAEDDDDTTDLDESGGSPGVDETAENNDLDGSVVTRLTVYVPMVNTPLVFQVEADKVVQGENISRVGRDRVSNPMAFVINNLGPGTATVDEAVDVTGVQFELDGGNKVIVKAGVNNPTVDDDTAYAGVITIDRGNFDLDDTADAVNTFTIPISADVDPADGLTFTTEQFGDDDTLGVGNTATAVEGINYSVTIPESTAPGTGVLPYFVHGALGVVDGDGDQTFNDIDAEEITGVTGGASAHLFRVNNETMAIEYSGPVGGLSADDDPHVVRLTASGDRGLANRLIVGMVKITVADVDEAPSNPGPQSAEIVENDPNDAGLVRIKDGEDDIEVLVKDFAGISTDPEGRDLIFDVSTDDFEFVNGTKLVVAKDIEDTGRDGDNPATADDLEENWPDDPPAGWLFAETPPTSMFPDLTRKVNITTSDGVPSNNQTFELTITLKVNTPPELSSDVVEVEDATTKELSYSYSTMASVDDDGRGVSILDLSNVVTDVQSGLLFTIDPIPAETGQPANTLPPELAVSGGNIVLLFVPSDEGTKTYNFILKASDGYNPAMMTAGVIDDDALDAQIEVTVVVTIVRPDLAYPTLRVNVAEEFEGDILDADGNAVSARSAIDGATDFEIIGSSGADGSTSDMADLTLDFDVGSATGVLSVVQKRDYDVENAILSPSLTVSASNDDGDDLGNITVIITVDAVNEPPVIQALVDEPWWVKENANDNDPVLTSATDPDPDSPVQVMADDVDTGDTVTFSLSSADADKPFKIDSASGKISVKGIDALNHETTPSYTVTVIASDGGTLPDGSPSQDTMRIAIAVTDANEMPYFIDENDDPLPSDHPTLAVGMAENVPVGHEVADYNAADPDENDILTFTLKNATDVGEFFALDMHTGTLTVKKRLDYETQATYLIEINVTDSQNATDEVQVVVTLTNVNDESPKFGVVPPVTSVSVPENTARGTFLANYGAADADGDTVKYSLKGDDAKSFAISQTGDLMTLESLDADSGTPCGAVNCVVIVVANDMPDAESGAPTSEHEGPEEATVRITVTEVEDSISIPHITKANPVPGVGMGKSGSALAGLKVIGDEYLWDMLDCPRMLDLVNSSDESIYCKMWDGLSTKAKGVVSAKLSAPEESPSDLPATYGDEGKGPKNFVETEWANWGTVLRIEVTAESPDATCGEPVGGNNNQCVVLIVKSDSADDVIHLAAYRSNEQENRYVAAVMLVELEAHASNYVLSLSSGDEVRTPIYRHQRVRNVVPSAAKTDPALQMPRLQADEEDEIEIEFHNLRTDIDVENEPPEISNVSPEHEAAFDDADVEYTFSVSDDNSGLPEPEDLPDANGDEDYTPVVGLVSDRQCMIDDPDDGVLARAIHIHESEYLYCGDNAQDGEYIASEGGWGFAPIRDDKDFDETSDGFDVETTLVLVKNEIFYVTFIACDRAGNCASYDPDGNDDDVELAKITIDTEVPKFVEARTGVKWDSSDNEYSDDRSFIQVIFDDLTPLNEETVESDDFVVEGHTVKAVYVYSPDDEDTLWADENSDGTLNADTDPTRYAKGGPNSGWGDKGALYRKIDRTVFLELEDELLADETPDVTIIPNGVEDQAGNEQDDGDVEAKDWIAPRFVVVSIVAADTPEGASNQLAGDGDEVTVMVTSDERLDQTRPTVTVTYVDASRVDTKGVDTCGTDGKRKRGEITRNTARDISDKCADNALATGADLNNHIEKITNTEWMVTVTEPKATGYYNFHIKGVDRSPKKNEGSEGVGADEIVTEFFDSDGDVNSDDAVFWEADINLPNPNIRVSGVAVTDNEASVEYRSPLFVEIDFTVNHWVRVDCDDVETDDRMANCMNENSEYSEDNFDDVVVTMFQLDGVDMTDSVKTTDSQTFLVSLESVSIGDHTVLIQGMDQAGNILEDTLEIDFEVNDRDPFEKRLSPGWNLVSLPGEPANSNIASVFGSDVEVRTVYTYDPVIPGGWMVAVRETLESDWQGDLTEISGQRGYWVLSDAIQDWEVSIPRLAGGAAGTGTPIQPPVIALYAGWNLIPVIDISGDGEGGDEIDAEVYLQKLGDGLDLARVLGFNTIMNQWQTVLDPDMQMNNTLEIGSAYWIFVREAASLVPSGFVGGGGGGD